MEARGKVPTPRCDCVFPPLLGQQAAHLECIAADRRRVETQIAIHISLSPGHERRLPEGLSQAIERVAQRMTRGLVVRLGPQQGNQAVPRLGARRFGQRQIEQESKPLGLGKCDRRSVPARCVDRKSAQDPDVDQGIDPAAKGGHHGDKGRDPNLSWAQRPHRSSAMTDGNSTGIVRIIIDSSSMTQPNIT